MSDERYPTKGIEALTDEERKVYEEEIEPLIDQLRTKAKQHGYVGMATLQMGTRIRPEQDEAGWVVGSFPLNIENFTDGAKEVVENRGGKFETLQEVKDFMDETGFQPPSPVITAIHAILTGSIDPVKVLTQLGAHSEFYAALEKLLGAEGLSLSEEQKDNLRKAFGVAPQGAPKKKDAQVAYAEVIGKDGQFIGFRNIVTGERDYLDGFGPDDDPTLGASGEKN